MLFLLMMKHAIKEGTLEIDTAEGRHYAFGDGKAPHVGIAFKRKNMAWSLAVQPDLRVPEAYMNGTLTIERGSLRDFLHLMAINYARIERTKIFRFLAVLSGHARMIAQFNSKLRARKNVAYHYDLPPELYDMFLDEDRQYSCAYFTAQAETLEEAQLNKKRHIASKLYLNRPGLGVLDIGCGWGGMGLYLAREAGCHVTGITLSVEQYRKSKARAQAAGLSRSCRFELRDYRDEKGPYDRIVSVGMFEHVGKKNYDEFFRRIHGLLDENGVCLLHAVGRFDQPADVNAFIRKHIFPGTDVAALSEVTEAIQRSGLFMTDIEILRLHYAETLKRWASRFAVWRPEAAARWGEEFCRKWELYLTACEMGFRHEQLMVFQIQLTKKLDAVPLTRDYMFDWERAHKTQPQAPAMPEKRPLQIAS